MTSCAKCDAPGIPASGNDGLPDGWEWHTARTNGAQLAVCKDCSANVTTSSRGTGNPAADQLRLIIERIERIEEEIKGSQDDRKDVYSEAKSVGYDVKTIRKVVVLRKQDPLTRQENDALLETYRAALGIE
jgi:uncharacterized protein (UPF0335 family)